MESVATWSGGVTDGVDVMNVSRCLCRYDGDRSRHVGVFETGMAAGGSEGGNPEAVR
jgi:hypothetical protein